MAKNLRYTTSKEQINHLKHKGLLFDDELIAMRNLDRYGYYNIINSYRGPYQTIINGKKEYLSDTTFEQIFSIFILDHNLRNSIMSSMLELEECLRAATAEVIAKNFGTDHNSYLNFKNYRDRFSSNPKFNLRNVLGTLHANIHSGKNPIRYYREKYGIVPPWILLKGTYFSTLINLIKFLKRGQKQELMYLLLSNLNSESVDPDITSMFQTTLFICLDYRNAAAHGGRIYNFQSDYSNKLKITDNITTYFPALQNVETQTGIHQPFRIVSKALDSEINRHLKIYPQDINLLSQSISMQINRQSYVYINEKTKIFHIKRTCSGISNAHMLPMSDDITTNYIPCKRCTTQTVRESR